MHRVRIFVPISKEGKQQEEDILFSAAPKLLLSPPPHHHHHHEHTHTPGKIYTQIHQVSREGENPGEDTF